MTESKILSMDFQKEWKTPQGRVMKIYHIQLEDGVSSQCYLQEPIQFNEGDKVNYELGNGKLKIYPIANRPDPKPSSNGGGSHGSHHQTYYLGYAYGYAKDIAIAEMQASASKTKKVSEKRLKELAETIYAHMGEMFKGSE